jgi:hypothetical protein
MTAAQSQWANPGFDVMKATSVHPVLYALLVCTFAGPPAYAAGVVVPGGGTEGTTGTIQRQDTGAIAGNGKRDAANRIGPIKGREATAGGSNAATTAVRAAQPTASQNEEAHTAIHSRGSLPVAHVYVSKRAIGATTRTYLNRRPAADVGAVRGNGHTSTLAALRPPSSGLVRGANLPIASLNATARNGVIGGARAPGRAMIGGPANTGSVIKAGIDGAMLRRRS